MNYTRFDRHENMSSETRSEILNLIGSSHNCQLTNMLFGLFDGYLYNKLSVFGSEEFNGEELERLEAVINEVRKYPQQFVSI